MRKTTLLLLASMTLAVLLSCTTAVLMASKGVAQTTTQTMTHMAFAKVPADGGKARCPTSHPTPVPRLQTNVEFPIPATRGKPTLSTASGTSSAYSTMHSAFFNAWDQARLKYLVDRCIHAAPSTATNQKPTECL